jgi:hypothetical protein
MSQLITCPECKKHLQVPEELLGKKVQCPECRFTFTAAESTPTEVVSAKSASVSRPNSTPSSTAKKKAEWDKGDEEEDTRSRKSKPPKIKRRNYDDDDDFDDDDDDDDRPRRRSRRSRYEGSRYVPHRGGTILAFGIVSLVSFVLAPVVGVTIILPLIFGPMAWFMGNADIAEIRAGRMDPDGEGMVQTGRIMGIISTVLGILGLIGAFGCCLVIILVPAMQKHG